MKTLEWAVVWVVGSVLIAVILLGAGCGGSGGNNTPDEPNPIPMGSPIGYGLANYWHRNDPHAFADLLASNGLNLTIVEAQPWFEGGDCGCKLGGGCSTQTFPNELDEFVGAMRAQGITTIVNDVNANNCRVRHWPDAEYSAWNHFVVGLGPDLLWRSPISEPWVFQSSNWSQWNSIARQSWSGVFIVPDKGFNQATGVPYFNVPHDLLDIHACSDDQALRALESGKPVLVNTDCSPVLNPGPDRAVRLTKAALEHGTPLVIYDFRGATPDQAVIEAMGREIRGS